MLALLVESVERDEVGSRIGFALSGVNLSVLTAPVLPGIIYEKVGYYAVFAICLAIIALDLLGALLLIDKRRARKWSLDSKQASDGSKHSNTNSIRPMTEENGGSPNSERPITTAKDDGDGRNDTPTAYPSPHLDKTSPLIEKDSSKAKIPSKK